MTCVAPYMLATGQKPLLLSMAIPGLLSLPDQPTSDEEQAYLTEVSHITKKLQELGGNCIKEAEQRIQQLTRQDEGSKVNPTALFFVFSWASLSSSAKGNFQSGI